MVIMKGMEMEENIPHKAKTKKGLIRASVIYTLLKSGNEFSNRVVFVKAADFIGPRIYKGIFGADFLDKLNNEKRIILFGKIALPHSFTYIDDFAMAMINVGNTSDALGQIWHVPKAPAIGLKKWIQLFETETNKKARIIIIIIIIMPKTVFWIVGYFNSLIKEFFELSYQFEHPYLVNHEKYIVRFGNHSADPSRIVRETVQWYRATQKTNKNN